MIWLVYGLMGVLLVGYYAFQIDPGRHGYSSLVDGWLVDAFEFAASVLCLARGLIGRSHRPAVVFLGAGLLAWSVGDLALTVESLGGATPSSPSLADGFYLGFFPLAYVAIVLFIRGEVRRLTTPSWLDGAVAGLGAAAVCAAYAFHSVLRSTGGDPLRTTVNLAYPVGDLLLLVLVVGGTVLLAGRRKAPWCLLAIGIALNVVGDTFNLFQSSIGASRVVAVVAATAWPTAILFMSMAVWMRPGAADPLMPPKPTGFALPGVAALAALGILVVGTLQPTDRVAVGLATATLAAVGVRLTLSVRGLRTLTLERQRLSVTDDLTGLGNRRHLFDVLDAYFEDESHAGVDDRGLAFLFIDLNHFKEINDSFGHPAGDELLKQLGPRLTGQLRPSDLLVRIGGDEFAVVLIGAQADEAITVAQRLIASLEEPFVLGAVRAPIGASVGIALAPDNASDSTGLVWCADVAMYRAKLSAAPFALYEPELDNENRMQLAEELHAAIQKGELALHYQPQLDLVSGEISTVEALVRWPNPRFGLIPPLKFLPLAEEAGLMNPLTGWVLTEAVKQCASWRASGRQITVSVNISATNLLDDGFTDMIRETLKGDQLPPDALIVEITETSIITEFRRSSDVIQELQALGVTVSIDDFGAGFTTLAHLNNLAIGELKLDRTFISNLAAPDSERNLELVRATIQLGHSLGLRVVAEGIEDQATLDLLTQLGCDLAQGYFISTPKPANKLNLRHNPTTAAASELAA